MKFFNSILKEFFYNGHFQIWGSLAIVVFAGQLLEAKINFILFPALYALFYFIYFNDRCFGIKSDEDGNKERTSHIKKICPYKKTIFLICGIIILLSLYFLQDIYTAFFIFLILFFGFLYPIYFKPLTKKILCFKNFYVAFVFAFLVFLLKDFSFLAVLIAIVIFFRALMMQFFLDLKDIESDKKQGLKTLGVLYKRKKVYNLISWLNFLTALTLPVLYFLFPSLGLPASILFLVILIPFDYFLLKIAMRGNYFAFVLEGGEFIFWTLCVCIGKLILNFIWQFLK